MWCNALLYSLRLHAQSAPCIDGCRAHALPPSQQPQAMTLIFDDRLILKGQSQPSVLTCLSSTSTLILKVGLPETADMQHLPMRELYCQKSWVNPVQQPYTQLQAILLKPHAIPL